MWLEYELASNDPAVQRFNYYTMKTPPHIIAWHLNWVQQMTYTKLNN